MSKITIVEGNSNDKDNVRAIMVKGERGFSAYEIAVQNGYEGTEEEWKDSFLNAETYYNKTETNNLLDKKTCIYDTVALMKSSTSLKAGMTVQTLGYYEVNDGGGATYKITDTESQSEYQEEVGDLYATLIIENEINVLQFGLVENTNESVKLQKMLDISSSQNLIINGLNMNFIVSGTEQVGDNFGLSITGKTTLKNIKLKIADNSPDLTCGLIVNIPNSSYVEIENIEIDGNYENQQPHTTPYQDGGKHGIRIESGNVNIKNSKFYDCYTDGIYFNENLSNMNLYNVEVYGNGRNGITDNSNISIYDNCFVHENGIRTNPKSGIHVEPNHRLTKSLLHIKNSKIINNTTRAIMIHFNDEGHTLEKLIIDNCECGSLGFSMNDDGTSYSVVNEVNILNSKFTEIINIGYVSSSSLNSGIKKINISNSKFTAMNIRSNYKIDVNIDNCFISSFLWNYVNINNFIIRNSTFYNSSEVSSDSASQVVISSESSATIDNLIIENCTINNYARVLRGNIINKCSILNTIINVIYNTFSGTITLFTLINSKPKSSSANKLFASNSATDAVLIGNDFREITTITATGVNITESANLKNM